MTQIEKNNIDEYIRQKLRKKDIYKSDMHKIYNIIVGQTDEQLQDKAVSEATFQAVKTDQYPIGYLMILQRIYFSNHPEHHPICSLCLATRCLYNTMQYANDNTIDYLVRFRNAQKVNEAYNDILTTRGVQYHGVKILFIFHTNEFNFATGKLEEGGGDGRRRNAL